MTPPSQRNRAFLMLLLANFLWGLSFPLTAALGMTHAVITDPSASGGLLTLYTIAPRFVLAVAILALWQRGRLALVTASEIGSKGLGLGFSPPGGCV